MAKRSLRTIWWSTLTAALLLSSAAVAADSETLLYARYLDEDTAGIALDRIADAQEEGALSVKAGAFIIKHPKGRLRVQRWRPTHSMTAGALIEGLIGVLNKSPGKLVSCPDQPDEPMSLRSCPEQENAYLTLAALGVPKPTVMRIRNSFPWWYTGYTADEAAIILVVPPGQVSALINRLRRTQVMDIIGYTLSSEKLQLAQEILQPPQTGR
jgi:hypothetical protein